MGWFGEKLREASLRFGHVRAKAIGYIGRASLMMELPGNGEGLKGGLVMGVREDMALVDVTEDNADDMADWRCKIRCGDP